MIAVMKMSLEPRWALAKKNATYQDVLDAPEYVNAEIIDGDLYLSARPHTRHSFATTQLTSRIVTAYDGSHDGIGGWRILFEPEVHLRKDVLVPDIAGWKLDRWPGHGAHVGVPPDWLCEVLSPSTGRFDRGKKLPVYAREGVPWVWLVDPVARMVEVFNLKGEHYSFLGACGADATVVMEPFAGLELELGGLWPAEE